MRLALLILALLLAGCLPPWPIGAPSPGGSTADDDDAVADDDDAVADDDDAVDDDDAADDDDASDDDDIVTDPDDVDGDGYPLANDCDDNNPSIFPGATEQVCDEIDQDCDGGDLCDVCNNLGVFDQGLYSSNLGAWSGTIDSSDLSYGSGPYLFEVYRFQAGLTGSWTFDMTSSAVDAYLEVRDSECSVITANDDGGDGTAARTSPILVNGDVFYVVTTTAFALETGDYSLTLLVIGI